MSIRRKVLLGFGLLLGLPCLVGLVAVSWQFWNYSSARKAYDLRVESIRAKGQVVDLAGRQKLHEERARPEGADQWNEIFQELKTIEFIEESMDFPYLGPTELVDDSVPARGEEWNLEEDAKKFLTNRKLLRDKLRKLGAQANPIYFPVTSTGGEPPQCAAHEPIQTAIYLLTFDGAMTLRFNASPIALEDVRALVGMRALLSGEPSVMAFFISDVAHEGALEIVRAGVQQHLFTEPQLRELLTLLEGIKPPQEHFHIAIEGERGELLASLEFFAKKQGLLGPLLGSPKARIEALDLIERIQAVNFDDLDKATADIDEAELLLMSYTPASLAPTSADHLAPMRVVGVNAMAMTLVNRQMQLQLAKLAIGIELYRLKHQKLPESIDEVADIGVDPAKLKPVGDKPFGYRLSEDKAHADLWGYSLPAREKEPPSEPLDPMFPDSQDRHCHWKL